MQLTNPRAMRVGATKGAILTGTAQIYRTGVNFVSSIFLARLLTPTDFGLIAMVSSCVALVMVIQDLGLNQATIQRARISRKQMSALFWLSVGSSLVLAVVLVLCAPGIAWFFEESRLTSLVVAFAVVVALGGLQSQQLALMNCEFRFEALAGIDALTTTAGAIAGVGVAWLTSSYWSLFTSSLVSMVASVVSVWLLCSFRPGPPSFEGDFREIISFGSAVSGFHIVNHFAVNADNVLIGKFYGSEPLGYYDRAYRLMLFPIWNVLGPLGRVMLPMLARLQSDPERYRKAYTECISLLMIATQPGIMFMIVYADDLFRICLGHSGRLPLPFSVGWACGLHQVVTSTVGWLYLSQGRSRDFFRIGLFNAVTTVASFVIGLPWGPLGVAIAYTITNYAIMVPATWWSTGLRGPVSTRDMVATSVPHALATALAGAMLIELSLSTRSLSVAMLFALACLSYATYGLIILLFPKKRQLLDANLRTVVGMFPSPPKAH